MHHIIPTYELRIINWSLQWFNRSVYHQQLHCEEGGFCTFGASSRCPLEWTADGSESNDSAIFSQIISTSFSNTAFTLIFSLAEVSKNSRPARIKCYQSDTSDDDWDCNDIVDNFLEHQMETNRVAEDIPDIGLHALRTFLFYSDVFFLMFFFLIWVNAINTYSRPLRSPSLEW